MSEHERISALILVIKKYFPDTGDDRAFFMAHEILDVLRRLEHPEKYES